LYVGLNEEELENFKEMFPYNFADLSVGFRYLDIISRQECTRRKIGDGYLLKWKKKWTLVQQMVVPGWSFYIIKICVRKSTSLLDVIGGYPCLSPQQDQENNVQFPLEGMQ
jgi:hypothetical protein